MTITADDLVIYAAISRPEDNVSTSGGQIDDQTRAMFTDVSGDSSGDLICNAGGADDGKQVAWTARLKSGSLVTVTATIASDSAAFDFTGDVLHHVKAHILTGQGSFSGKAIFAARGVNFITMKVGDRGWTRLFINASKMSSHGVDGMQDKGEDRKLYEKVFYKNNSGADTLHNAVLLSPKDNQEIIPPELVYFGVAGSFNDQQSTANRLTPPDGIGFSGIDKEVPGLNMSPATAIGVWFQMTLHPLPISQDPPFMQAGAVSYQLVLAGEELVWNLDPDNDDDDDTGGAGGDDDNDAP